MTRKELNGSFYAKQLIRSYQEQIKELQEKSLSLKSSSRFNGAPPSSNQSKKAVYTAYIEQIICLEEKLQDAIERQLQAEAKTTEYIEQFNDETEKLLLRLRYIEHMSWSEIADEMNYSERHILRLHREILKRCQ